MNLELYKHIIIYNNIIMQSINQNSSFCKNCENFMDITNNISIVSNDITDNNLKGGLNQDGIESSDYDVSISDIPSESMIGVNDINISDNDISEVLNGTDIEMNLKNFSINDLNKNPIFNKLTNNQKTLVINRFLEKIPKNKSLKKTEIISNKESYFYCKSCGYNEKIPDKQLIFSKGDENKDDLYNYQFINYINDNTLPRSKKYNCINDNCPTHKNPSLKLAVFYRQKGSYNIRYICTICNNFWNTFITPF